MRRLAVVAGALALAFAAAAEKTSATSPRGDGEARKHLAIAMENSPTRKEHALYAAKLDRLSSYRPR